MTDYDPLARLGLTEIVEDFGLSCLPQLMAKGDPEAPRLPLIEPGDGSDLEHIQRAIFDLEATLNPDQRQQLTTIVAGLCVHMLELAAPDVQEREKREAREAGTPTKVMQDEAWIFAVGRWRSDPAIRTGQMALEIHAHLRAEGYRPPTTKTIREEWMWYRPENAKLRGRPRNK